MRMESKRLCATCANAIKHSGCVERCKIADDTADRAEIAKQIAKATAIGGFSAVPPVDYFCKMYKVIRAATVGACEDYQSRPARV